MTMELQDRRARHRIHFELDCNRRRLMYVFRLLTPERFEVPVEPGGPTARDLLIDLILLEASLTRRVLATGVRIPPGTLSKDPAEMEDATRWRTATIRRLRAALTGNRKRTLRLLDVLSDEDLRLPVPGLEPEPSTIADALVRPAASESAVADRLAAAFGLRIP